MGSSRLCCRHIFFNINPNNNNNFSRNPQSCQGHSGRGEGASPYFPRPLPYPLYFWLFLLPSKSSFSLHFHLDLVVTALRWSVRMLISWRLTIYVARDKQASSAPGSGWWGAATLEGVGRSGHQKKPQVCIGLGAVHYRLTVPPLLAQARRSKWLISVALHFESICKAEGCVYK